MSSKDWEPNTTYALPSWPRGGLWLGGVTLSGLLGCNSVLGIDEAALCAEGTCGVLPPGSIRSEKQGNLPGPDSGSGESEALPNAVIGAVIGAAMASDAGAPSDAGFCGGRPPPNFAAACGSCGGAIDCSGGCSVGTPSNFGQACGSCGGSVTCDGSCSVPTPAGVGAACGSCGGTLECSGNCSVATPSDYGSVILRDTMDSFSCCLIDETRSYGADGRGASGCYPGYTYGGCTISKISGLGAVSVVREDPATCTCEVAVQNTGLDGATYTVHMRLTRGCNQPR